MRVARTLLALSLAAVPALMVAQPASDALYFEESGSQADPPLICLHGYGASTYSWREVLPTLSAHHHVFTIDLKGFGKSPKPEDGHYSLHDQAALVQRFIADHSLDRVTLVGHSFGGGVALAVAIELVRARPDALTSLVLIDAASYRQSMPFFIAQFRWPLFGRTLQSVVSTDHQVRYVLRKAYYDDRLVPEASVKAYAAALHEPGGRYALRETARQIVPDDVDELTAAYPTIEAPTLIIWGRHDEIVPLSVGERLHAAIPHSRLVIVENAGHAPHEETSEQVRAILEQFFR